MLLVLEIVTGVQSKDWDYLEIIKHGGIYCNKWQIDHSNFLYCFAAPLGQLRINLSTLRKTVIADQNT